MDHTATPWTVRDGALIDGGGNANRYRAIDSRSGSRIAFTCSYANPGHDDLITQQEAEANAAFIVTACNAHDALVAALEDVAISHFADGSPCFCTDPPRRHEVAQHSTRCTAARAALALARGEVQP